MVRRSTLVYDLLRSEQPSDGLSLREILRRISSKHDIAASKTLQRDVAVALRRGLDFGILAKKRNKFRFDPGQSARHNVISANTTTKRRKAKNKKKKASDRSSATKGRRRSSTRGGSRRKQPARTPRPKLPKPPSWSPKRRVLSEEPIPKVIKHS